MFSKMLSNKMGILHLSQAIYTEWEIHKLLQDPMSHYMDIFPEFSSGIIVHLLSTLKLIPSSDSDG